MTRDDFSGIVTSLCEANDGLTHRLGSPSGRLGLPSRATLNAILDELRAVLFPGYYGQSDLTPETVAFHMGAVLDGALHKLREQVRRGLWLYHDHDNAQLSPCDVRADDVIRAFARRLPVVRQRLASDVLAAYEGDPAARSLDEPILSYPGVTALTYYRLAHELQRLEVPLIPRIITEIAHSKTGIDIHPGATIGERCFIDHGTGVVIGETSILGQNVRIYQGVTLGAKSFPKDGSGALIKGIPRHPIVEDDVTIYAGATILGRITVGRGSIIGGNVWVTRDVPPGARITQAVARTEHFEAGAGI
ncbi:MAG: serine acetyltransferase [Deltaproteobacteria bacterium]|nr:MAG: serine acetyltransferase [Deltaproteobacteria bacterium]